MTATTDSAIAPIMSSRVHRIEVRSRNGEPDPLAAHVQEQARQALNPHVTVETARVFLIEAPIDDATVRRLAEELLADPVNQAAHVGVSARPERGYTVEIHYKPGVMDPVAQSTQEAILEMLPALGNLLVRTGFRYDLHATAAPEEQIEAFARASLANPVIQDIYTEPYHPAAFLHGTPYELRLRHVPIRELDDAALMKLSREGHLFLSLAEMQAIREYFRGQQREPTDIELETLAQTWSEHCVHKTLKATIRYSEPGRRGMSIPGDYATRPGHMLNEDGSVTIANLLKSTIAAATRKLMEEEPFRNWCVSVFVDNAGIVRFDDTDGVCIKVETHNHPSAIEPYGGAATGIGGCIRDVMGTGLSAKPIANTDVFCVAPPDLNTAEIPGGVIHPQRILQQVVAGVRDYGNRMGIPTINGAVWFHPDYLGNPLVFCGCVGLIPLDKCFGDPRKGDRIIALGGRTGRDGIHGATFSSAELTDTHADEFSHAVQIGNAITEKKTLDVILQARDYPAEAGGPLFNAITDCGAGGFSSAVGEMGKDIGARVTLETAPLKYDGLSYTEIWISEAQERMVLSVPPHHVEKLRELCEAENVEVCDLGVFGESDPSGSPQIVLTYKGTEVGTLSTQFLHEGIPTPTREATWSGASQTPTQSDAMRSEWLGDQLRALLAHPNIASKHWIIRQYDHEVQGAGVIKPLVGPMQDGPSDASVIRPKLTSDRGLAIGCGLATGLGEKAVGGHGDSYWMALGGIDEAVRNLVCVGADPARIAILDNFCWPRCDEPANLGSLVRAAEACHDGALAYRTPFVSGKDSLSNQFTTEDGRVIAVPPTLLITAMGIVHDVTQCRTMDAKAAGNLLLIVGQTGSQLGGSHYLSRFCDESRDLRVPQVDLKRGPATALAVADLIARGRVVSAHDCSDGGLLVAAAEMAFAGRIGLDLNLEALPTEREMDPVTACFAETPSRYMLEIEPAQFDAVARSLRGANIPFGHIGSFAAHDRLTVRTARAGRILDEPLDGLRETWLKPLDW